jgi:hypothetical protein
MYLGGASTRHKSVTLTSYTELRCLGRTDPLRQRDPWFLSRIPRISRLLSRPSIRREHCSFIMLHHWRNHMLVFDASFGKIYNLHGWIGIHVLLSHRHRRSRFL